MRPRHLIAFALAVLVPAGALQAAGARSFKTGPIQITADGAHVWVANPDNDSVTRIDARSEPAAGAVTEYPLPGPGPHSPRGLAVTEDGREVWVACHDSDAVFVLAGTGGAQPAGSVLARIDLPFGSGPAGVAISRDQSRALITCLRSGRLVLASLATHAVTDDLPTFRAPFGACFLEDGVSAWISHLRVADRLTRLGRLDLSGPVPVVTTLHRQDGSNPQDSAALRDPDPSHNIAEGGYLHFRGNIAQLPGGGRLWVPTQYSNTHDTATTPESIVQATIRTVDMASRSLPNTLADKVILTAKHVHDPRTGAYIGPGWDAHVAGPVDIAFSADAQWAYVVMEQSEDVVAFRTSTPAANLSAAPPLTEIPVGFRPQGIAVSPVSARAYVANVLSRTVSVLDLTPGSEAELRQLPVTPVTGERVPASVRNGERIFHSSNDPRISANEKVACASCHVYSEDDGRPWDLQFLAGTHGPRATQNLLGMSLSFGPPDSATGFGQLHRSGDRDEVQDFEHTFISRQMGGTGFLSAATRQPPLGAGPNAGVDADLDDLAAYVLQLPALARSPYRAPDGAMTESAVRGATIFRGAGGAPGDADCASCHVPETGFTDQKFHDVGIYRDPAERELNARTPAWSTNTPSLVGMWADPPYAGASVAKDPDTILDYLADLRSPSRVAPHGRAAALTGRQVQDLADFLAQIDGRMTAADVRNAIDDAPPRLVRVEPVSDTRIVAWFSESVAASAASPAAWRVTGPGGAAVRVTGATLDAPNEDRVTLTVDPMPHDCGGTAYTVAATSSVVDRADSVTGGRANALSPLDPANTRTFTLGDTLTVTFGASGYDDFVVPVHDAGANAFLDNVTNSSIYLTPPATARNCSFVRFEWSDALRAASGPATSADILDATVSAEGSWGDSQAIELRRVLQPWWDGGLPDQSFNPPVNPASGHSGPTRHWSEFNVRLWNADFAGARQAGVDGRNAADYLGVLDAGYAPDAVVTMTSIVGRTAFRGVGVTDAYRFWFDNPSLDFGHVFELTPSALNESKFRTGEEEWRLHGPVLSITYRLPPAVSSRPREVSAAASGVPLLLAKDPAGLRLSFEDLGAEASAYSVYEGLVPSLAGGAPWYSHAAANPGSACGTSPAPAAGGRREIAVAATPRRNEYFLVTAALGCGESASGFDSAGAEQDSALLDCLP